MRIHSFIKVFVAALTIAFAMTMSTVHGSTRMQLPVLASNVTQVRMQSVRLGEGLRQRDISDMWCGTYDKVAPKRWVLRTNEGQAFQFVEWDHAESARSVMLEDASRHVIVELNFGTWNASAGIDIGNEHRSVRGMITGYYEVSADTSPETCKQTAAGVKCNCDLGSLRPLQGAVGMEEVRKKRDDIVSGTKTRFDLAYDPIKLVRGPNGLFYVTDHHHGARAWIEAGHTMGTCQIQSDTISTDPTQFWADLNARKLVRLVDQNGNPLTVAQLPTTLRALPDDPYRTLAWRVRKKDGFCRALMTGNTEFAEFQWADWLRTRITPLPREGQDWSKRKRDEAVALAKTPAAAGLPGYRGDQPANYTCAPDPD